MKIQKIYLGSWFPKTLAHLIELEQFLKKAKVTEGLDKKRGRQISKTISASKIEMGKNLDDITMLTSKIEGVNFKYFEDGLLLLSKSVSSIKNDILIVNKTYEKITKGISFLFGRGAKGLEVIRKPGSSKRPVVVGVKNTKSSIDSFFKKLEDEYYRVDKYSNFYVYHGRKFFM